LNSEGLFRPPIKHFLLNHGQVTLSGRYYSTGQVRGSTFPDQVEDRLRSSGLAWPSFFSSWPEAMPYHEDVERYKKNASFYRNAPTLIGVFVSEYTTFFDQILLKRESFDSEAREILGFRRSAPTGIQSAAAAVTTMLLVFQQMGLGAIWLAGPLQAKKEIEKILKGPANMSLVCLVGVGYPDESPQKDRKPVDQVLEFIC
jgi:nitroreductase